MKLKRAQHHLRDINAHVRALVGPNQQSGRVRVERTKNKRTPFVYYLDLDIPEDEMLPVLIGDYLFNLRSALDHIAVANVPSRRKSKASFPIFTADVWAPVPPKCMNAEEVARKQQEWTSKITGMKPKVLAVIKSAQPYVLAAQVRDDVENNALALLSAFENADKHRELVIVAHGLAHPFKGTIDGRVETFPGVAVNQMLRNGAILHRSNREVDVQITGSVKIAMARSPQGVHRELPGSLYQILLEVSAVIQMIESVM